VKGFGAGMDYDVYDTLAYQKALMLLVMAGETLGEDAMRKTVAQFFDAHRGTTVAWADVSAALAAAGAGAKEVMQAWDAPGVPTIAIESQSKKSGARWSVTGKVSQSGTSGARPMWVRVVATCGKLPFPVTVKLAAAEAPFTIAVPLEPESVVLDPDFLVLARRPSAGGIDSEKLLADAFAVVNAPGDDDPAHCASALAALQTVLKSGDEKFAGQCHVGIGRLLFRTGKLDDAKAELETALKLGGFGPFHRSWALLRLGCIADLAKKRDDAVARYKAAVELKGANDFVVQKAKQFLERPYRGYEKDK
jgi:tetratricopeptide (TPR) repeat protein